MAAELYSIPTSRRSVLGAFGALGAGALTFAGARAAPSASDVDVVIVGAGAAGIGAAIALQRMGVACRIVEAAGRVGGRALTDSTTFKGAGGKAVPFDIGCAWIHRYRDDDPFAAWSKKLQFTTQMHDLSVTRLFYGKTPYSSAMVQLLGKTEESLHTLMAESPDVAAGTLVKDRQPPMDAAMTYMGPMDMAVDFDSLSTADFAAMADYDPNYLVREGYGTLVKAVAMQAGLDIVRDTPVTAIDYSGPDVRVMTSGAHAGTIRAKAVIVTVSTGVLAAGAIRFTPDLPATTQGAIADVPMGLLAKIPLQIPGISHYLGGIGPYDNVLQQNGPLDDIYFLAWPWDSDLMVGFVGGKFAWDLSTGKGGQRAAVAYAKERLSRLFGSGIARRVTRGLLTPWGTDPLARGAYSAAKPGKHASRLALAQPVEEKVFFAGEAVAPGGMFATCSGAYMSGTTVAHRIGVKIKPG